MRRLKILIADDHQLMIHAIRLALEDNTDIEIVAEADSGSKVMPLIGQTSPDLVLLDVRMPGMDGLTVLERVRARYPKVRVAIQSTTRRIYSGDRTAARPTAPGGKDLQPSPEERPR